MMLTKRELDIDVVTAARQRIKNLFSNNMPLYLNFSGGKDGLVLGHLIMDMILKGEIDKSLLRVDFIDEEAIFPCVERIVLQWRARWIRLGVPFNWYCVEVAHYSCINMLEKDEDTFVCWDREKRDVWVRDMPEFAITEHPALVPRHLWSQYKHRKTYQEFLSSIRDGLRITGVRAAESVQRVFAIGSLGASGISNSSTVAPLYDWTDHDVWLYLREHNVDIPEAYMYLYQIGQSRKYMRISQFFSVDTAQSLARMAEFYPDLMERIIRREPAAYLVSLYWDSEMFRRKSRTRKQIEQEYEAIDYRARFLALLASPPSTMLKNNNGVLTLGQYQALLLKFGSMMQPKHFQTACEALVAGDPKGRVCRGLQAQIIGASRKDTNAKGKAAATAARVARAPIAGDERARRST